MKLTQKEQQIMAVGMIIFLVIMAAIIGYVLYSWHLSNLRNEENKKIIDRLAEIESQEQQQ